MQIPCPSFQGQVGGFLSDYLTRDTPKIPSNKVSRSEIRVTQRKILQNHPKYTWRKYGDTETLDPSMMTRLGISIKIAIYGIVAFGILFTIFMEF